MLVRVLGWEVSITRVFLYTDGQELLHFVKLKDGWAIGLTRRIEIVISRSRKTSASDPRI